MTALQAAEHRLPEARILIANIVIDQPFRRNPTQPTLPWTRRWLILSSGNLPIPHLRDGHYAGSANWEMRKTINTSQLPWQLGQSGLRARQAQTRFIPNEMASTSVLSSHQGED